MLHKRLGPQCDTLMYNITYNGVVQRLRVTTYVVQRTWYNVATYVVVQRTLYNEIV